MYLITYTYTIKINVLKSIYIRTSQRLEEKHSLTLLISESREKEQQFDTEKRLQFL